MAASNILLAPTFSAQQFSAQLPWDPIPEVEQRFRRLLSVFLALIVLVALAVQLVVLPAPERSAKPVISERLVKMVLEQKAQPLPPPPAPVASEVEAKDEIAETETEAVPDEPVAKPVPSAEPTPGASTAPEGEGERKLKARAQAKQQIAVFDALADLRVEAEPAPGKRLDAIVAPTQLMQGDSALTQRALIADQSKAGSGGVSIGRISTDQGSGGGLSGTGTSRVVSGIGGLGSSGSGLGGTGSGSGGAIAGNAPASTQAKASTVSAAKARRSDESISLGFDGAHGALQALYQRALRSNPEMQGKITFRLEIQPDGRVSACEIVVSELGDAELERKLAARVRQIDFGAKDVAVWRDVYFVDFFPS